MEGDQTTPIAIVGINLKFPGEAVSPQAFWELMQSGRNVAREVPKNRFNVDAFYHPDPARLDSLRIRHAHFMEEDPRAFDAPFFSISQAEAAVMDAQQRGLLEGAYRAFENAGIPIESIAGSKTSVFSASFVRDHEAITARDFEYQSPYQATGSGSSMLSNRLSHFFDLSGPSLTVDTACSSSLYAFHLGCQSLLRGESSMSLICGSNTFLTPECQALALSNGGFLSPTGRCYSFDHKANGYGRGEGYGFVVLKRLDDAIRDGNVIRAVVRASGANQDGRTPVITQPSQQAQTNLIRDTYNAAGLNLADTQYVEAHGTGTPVGDPIEASAIGEAFRGSRDEPIWIGSVKSNIGHLEGCSGLAGVIKAVLALESAIIPPIADFDQPNPAINLDELQVQFPAKPIPWPTSAGVVRRASVSSFGYGGSNAHVILDDSGNYLRTRGLQGLYRSKTGLAVLASSPEDPDHPRLSNGAHTNGVSGNGGSNGIHNNVHLSNGFHHNESKSSIAVLPFSAGDQQGTRRQAEVLQDFLARLAPETLASPEYLADLAYTLSARRSLLKFRSFAIVDSLSTAVSGGLSARITSGQLSVGSNVPELSFVFTGQGAQHATMGCELATTYSVVRESLEECDKYLRSIGCTWSLIDELARAEDEGSRINEPALSQPLSTAVQVALVDLLRTWGVSPRAVCGHSSGEVAAAYCAGAFSRESAWRIAYCRGLVASRQVADPSRTPTTMMSVGLSQDAVQEYVQGSIGLTVACVNSPVNVTLSGPVEAMSELYSKLDERQIFARKLPVNIGYHSEALRDGAAEYTTLIGKIKAPENDASTDVKFYSSTEGSLIGLDNLRSAAYWVKNLLSPVLFSSAVTAMIKAEGKTTSTQRQFLLEIGPQSALRRPIKDTLEPVLGPEVANGKWQYATALQGTKQADAHAVLQAIGTLWCSGVTVDMAAVNEASISNGSRKPRLAVDLPSYPFSRTELYWDESRLSRAYSNRPHRRHALLGIRDRDWNPDEMWWRHPIRFAENPWILDHALNKSAIYPGAGMLVMAIEAVRQLADVSLSDRISGYRLENIRFLRSIAVNESERGTEAKLYLRPRRSTTSSSANKATANTWYDWRVFGTEGDDWLECAYGSIKIELEASDETSAAGRRTHASAATAKQYEEIAEQCCLGVQYDQMYKSLSRKSGFDYGPYFQTLRNIRYDREGHAAAVLHLRDYAKTMQFAGEDPCVIHPTTLDSIFHLGFVSLSEGGWKAMPTLAFTHLSELWISHKLLRAEGNPQLRVAARQTSRALREFEWDAAAVFADNAAEPAIAVKGERGTVVAAGRSSTANSGADADANTNEENDEEDEDGAARLSYGIDYEPDLSLLNVQETQDLLLKKFNTDPYFSPPSGDVVDRGDAIALYYFEKVLKRIDEEGTSNFDKHLMRYVAFMRRIVNDRDRYTLASRGLQHLSIEQVLEEADNEPTQKLVKKAGEHLYQILVGAENALQIVFEGHLADDFYHSDVWSRNYRKVGAYISMLAHSNPQLRILEVGAGTGSSTGKILPMLVDQDNVSGDQMVRFGEYAYTDVSPGFFERARENFSYAEKHMRFQKLDLEVDPTTQGFVDGTYDVIMAGNCVHTVSDVVRTLRWLKKLLRPGGKIILAETTVLDNIRDAIIFGLLPGWWMRDGHWWSERGVDMVPDEDQGPILTEKQWGLVLKEAGFEGGVEMLFRDHETQPHHRVSLLVSSAPTEQKADRTVNKWTILENPCAKLQHFFSEALQKRFVESNWADKFEVVQFQDLARGTWAPGPETKVISLIELDATVLGRITVRDGITFEAIKKLALNAKHTIWLSTGGAPRSWSPTGDIAVGFGRAVCSERGDQSFVNLVLENTSEEGVPHVMRLVNTIDQKAGSYTELESEYTVDNGVISIPRIVPQKKLNRVVADQAKQPAAKTFTLSASAAEKPYINLMIDQPGLLDTLYYTELDPSATEAPLQADEVEIEVQAASLNFKDVMVALGQVPGDGFGLDGAGIVTRTGPDCELRPGDGVFYFRSGGCCGTYIRTSELSTERIPRGMNFQAAATVPTIWCTVIYAFDWVARLRAGETVLIHAGAGAVGQAAIRLAKLRGVSVEGIYVTVGSDAKRQLVKDTYGLLDDHIFYSRDSSFAADLLHATKGRGVDVVLNSLGGELLQQSWRCTAPYGRFIDIGKADILSNSALAMGQFKQNVTFSAVDISIIYDDNKPLLKRILKDVLKLFEQNPQLVQDGAPKPLHVFPPSRIEEPFRALQTGKMAGKAVIDFSASADGDAVTYRPASRPAYMFGGAKDATYVISGGLGGLGRELVRWMFGRGARNFILMSSKGAVGRPDAAKFIQEMEQKGAVIVAPPCDITRSTVLEKTLKSEAVRSLPPIKGCIQAAMVLSDDMLLNMTPAQFAKALAPKFQGSWNLHELLPKDMDFMVFLSSMSGIIGNPSQANYAAGNTFEDSLARHRTNQGLKGVSFNLTLVLEAGWANDNYENVTRSIRAGMGGMTIRQVTSILDVLCDPAYDCTGVQGQVLNVHDRPSHLYRMFQDGVLHWLGKPMMRNLLRLGQAEATTSKKTAAGSQAAKDSVDYIALVREADGVDVAGQVVAQALLEKLSKSISVPTEAIDTSLPAYEAGVDSLIAVELRYWFLKQFGVEVPVTRLLKKQSIVGLCKDVAQQVIAAAK